MWLMQSTNRKLSADEYRYKFVLQDEQTSNLIYWTNISQGN